jgi:pimeloyl-ACP methyl ester carboxylesterase
MQGKEDLSLSLAQNPNTANMNGRVLTSSDGGCVYAEAFGDPTKPPIVFIHGFSLTAAVWEALFREAGLKDHFYLV